MLQFLQKKFAKLLLLLIFALFVLFPFFTKKRKATSLETLTYFWCANTKISYFYREEELFFIKSSNGSLRQGQSFSLCDDINLNFPRFENRILNLKTFSEISFR